MANPTGPDVSRFQPGVSWVHVRSQGASFMFAKTSESTSSTSEAGTSWGYCEQAQKQGMIAGTYHFLRPGSPTGNVDHYVATAELGRLRAPYFPGALDAEVGGISPSYMKTAIGRLRARTGRRKVIVYTFISFYNTTLRRGAGWQDNDVVIWMAHYGSASAGVPCTIWQYADAGKYPGDQNVSMVSLDALKTIAGDSSGANTPTPVTPTTGGTKDMHVGVARLSGGYTIKAHSNGHRIIIDLCKDGKRVHRYFDWTYKTATPVGGVDIDAIQMASGEWICVAGWRNSTHKVWRIQVNVSKDLKSATHGTTGCVNGYSYSCPTVVMHSDGYELTIDGPAHKKPAETRSWTITKSGGKLGVWTEGDLVK